MRDTADEYFVNRGRLPKIRHDPVRRNNTEQKLENESKEKKPRESVKCFNCGEMGHFANVCPVPQKNPRCGKCKKFHGSNESCKPPEVNSRRLGAENRDQWFTKEIVVQSKPYIAFIDTGSQASIVRKSVAQAINGQMSFGSKRTEKVPITETYSISKLLINVDNDDDKAKLSNLLETYADVFATGLEGIGKTNVVEANISIEEGKVISQAPYRIPEPKREIVNQMIDELLRCDIISMSTSEYASPIVLIKKQNGGDRLCVDYRRLNKCMKKENFPVPNIEERLQEAKQYKYFSSLDLNSGYYQIEVAPESRKYTAFITTDGLFEFKRMPFGLKNAPAIFNRLMAELQKRVQKGDMMHYMDDILIGSHSFNEMHEKLGRILEVLRNCGLTLNIDKCEFFKQSITFLGHQIHPQGISLGEVKTNAIALFPMDMP